MKISLSFFVTTLLIIFSGMPHAMAQHEIPTAEQQVEAAVLAAPQDLRDGAKVYGYSPEGEWATLREGSNSLICVADDPTEKKFHVACYHMELEPFMKRGRELRRKGLTRKEVDQKRREEIESGQLSLPRKAMTLYSLSGENGAYNYETGALQKAQPLTVVYVPFGTQKSTGMTTTPSGSGPWLMEPGTPWAHIMISGKAIGEKAQE